MSYAYTLSDRALAGLRKMEIWLQEETLDELDRIASLPKLPGRRIGQAIVFDFVRERSAGRAYVFITVFPDEMSRVLRVTDIGSCILRSGNT